MTRSITLGLFALALVVLGCGATNGGVRFDNPPDTYKRAPDGPAHPSSQEVAIVSFVGDATSELNLTEDQRKSVTTILDAVTEKHSAALLARKTLSVDLSRAVEAGALDEPLLLLDAKNLGDARAAAFPDDVRALGDLHALMNPAQRKAFAAALIARADHLKVDDTKSRMTTWSNDLNFDAAQRAKIEAKLTSDSTGDASARTEHDIWDKRLRATAAAFGEATFQGDVFIDKNVVDTTTARTARLLGFLRAVLPELTKAQLSRAADVIRSDVGLPTRGATEGR
jgi:hypothetical protein